MASSTFSSALAGAVGGTAVGAAVVKLVLDTKSYQAELAKAKGTTEAGLNAQTGAVSRFSTIAKAAYLAAGAAAVGFAAVAIRSALEQQKIIAQLSVAYGDNTQALVDNAQALSTQTGFIDDAIMQLDIVAKRFNVGTDQLKLFTQAAMDYARATGQDLVSAALNLGRASLGNARALKTIGVQFTATGNQAKDMASVLGLVEQKVGGAADAFSRTSAGGVARFQAALHNLADTAGTALLPAFNTLVGVLTKVMPLLTAAANNLAPIGAAFAGWTVFKYLPALLFGIGQGLEAIGATRVASGIANAAGAMQGLGAVATSVAVTGVFLIAKAFTQASDDAQSWEQATRALSDQIRTTGLTFEQFMASADARRFIEVAGSIMGTDEATRKLAETFRAAQKQAKGYSSTLEGIIDANNRAAAAAKAQRQAEQALAGGLVGLIASLQQVRDDQKAVNDLRAKGRTDTRAYRDAELQLLQDQGSLNSSITEYIANLKKSGDSQAQATAKLTALGRQAGLTRAEIRSLVSSVSSYIAGLDRIPRTVQTQVRVNYSYQQGQRRAGGLAGGFAGGFHGVIDRPQWMLVGEAGPERVEVTPGAIRRGEREQPQSPQRLSPYARRLLERYSSWTDKYGYGVSEAQMRRLLKAAEREGVGRAGLRALTAPGLVRGLLGPSGGTALITQMIRSGEVSELARFAMSRASSRGPEAQSYLFGRFPQLQAGYMRQLGWSEDRIAVAQQTGHDPGPAGSSSQWYKNWQKGMKAGLLTVARNLYGLNQTYPGGGPQGIQNTGWGAAMGRSSGAMAAISNAIAAGGMFSTPAPSGGGGGGRGVSINIYGDVYGYSDFASRVNAAILPETVNEALSRAVNVR